MAYSRAEYLKSLYRMRNAKLNKQAPLLDKEDDSTDVGDELSSFAYMNTPVESSAVMKEPKVEEPVVSKANVDTRNWWEKTWDTISDFNNNVMTGVLNFVDGIGDAIGLMVGGIAEAAGNQQLADDIKNNWIDVDWVTPTVASTDLILNANKYFFTGEMFTPEYWSKFGEDINFDERDQNTKTMQDFQANKGWFGDNEVWQSITTGIGSVLPSIALGIVTAGASVPVQMAVTLAPMAVSAFGNEGQEALQEGATYGQAAAAGGISAAIETGTELASAGIAKGISKMTGGAFRTMIGGAVAGSSLVGKTAGQTIKNVAKESIVEGLEEVASELLNPLAKQVYQGDKAWDKYKDGSIVKDAALAFAGGAVGSLVGGGISNVYLKTKLGGKTGVQLAQEANEIQGLAQELGDRVKKGKLTQEQANEIGTKIEQRYNQYLKDVDAFEKSDPTNFKKFANAMMNIKETAKEANVQNISETYGKKLKVAEGVELSQFTKDSYMVKIGNQNQIVSKMENGKYQIATVKGDTVTNVRIAERQPKGMAYSVVPKTSLEAYQTTNAVDRNTGKVIRISQSFGDNTLGDDFKGMRAVEEGSSFIYADKPLYSSDMEKALPWNKVFKTLKLMNTSQREYAMEIKGRPTTFLNYLSKHILRNTTVSQLLNKLGYDAFNDETTNTWYASAGQINQMEDNYKYVKRREKNSNRSDSRRTESNRSSEVRLTSLKGKSFKDIQKELGIDKSNQEVDDRRISEIAKSVSTTLTREGKETKVFELKEEVIKKNNFLNENIKLAKEYGFKVRYFISNSTEVRGASNRVSKEIGIYINKANEFTIQHEMIEQLYPASPESQSSFDLVNSYLYDNLQYDEYLAAAWKLYKEGIKEFYKGDEVEMFQQFTIDVLTGEQGGLSFFDDTRRAEALSVIFDKNIELDDNGYPITKNRLELQKDTPEQDRVTMFNSTDTPYLIYDDEEGGNGAGTALGYGFYAAYDYDGSRKFGKYHRAVFITWKNPIIIDDASMYSRWFEKVDNATFEKIVNDLNEKKMTLPKDKLISLGEDQTNDFLRTKFLQEYAAKDYLYELKKIINKHTGYDGVRYRGNDYENGNSDQVCVWFKEDVKLASNMISNKFSSNLAFSAVPKNQNIMPSKTEVIKNSANLTQEKVYNITDVRSMVNGIITEAIRGIDNVSEVRVAKTLVNDKFTEINLTKNMDATINNIVNAVGNSTVKTTDGQTYRVSTLLSGSDMRATLRDLMRRSGDKSQKVKWSERINRVIRNYGSYVREQALRYREYNIAKRMNDRLTKIYNDTRKINLGGENIVQEIEFYKQLNKNFQLTKTGRPAPSSLTGLVKNFDKYTPDGMFKPIYDQNLKDMADLLKEKIAEDKNFGKTEPTLEQMQLYNAIRGYVIQRSNALASEKHQRMVERHTSGVRRAAVALPAVKNNRYGKLKNIGDSAVSLPVYLKSYLGADHPFVKLFWDKYENVSSLANLRKDEFRKYTNEELAKEAGFSKQSELRKTLKDNVFKLSNRAGKSYNISNNYIVSAYWLYRSNQEQLVNTGLTQYDSKGKTSNDFKITEEQYQEMFSKMPSKVKKWADLVFEKYYNGKDFEYKNKKYKLMFGTELPTTVKGNYVNTSRVGQTNLGIGAKSPLDAGFLSTMIRGFLKERVNNKNHFQWARATDMLESNINNVVEWGEKSQWVEEIRTALNTTIPEQGNHTLEYYMKENLPEWQNVWSPYMTKLVLGKPIITKQHGLIEAIGNAGQAATLGLNLGSILRQTLSDAAYMFDDKVSFGMWLSTFPNAVKNFFQMGSIKKELTKYNGFFIERFDRGDVFKAMMNGTMPRKIAQIVLKPMEWLDSVVVTTHGYALAQRIVNNEIKQGTFNFAKGSEQYKTAVAKTLQELVLLTQSNSDPMFMSRLRSGDAGWLAREVFGRFASDNQNKWQAVKGITSEKVKSDRRKAAYEKAMNDTSLSEEARAEYRKAYEEEDTRFKKNYGKQLTKVTSALLLGAVGEFLIRELVSRIRGKKKWDEPLEPKDAALNIFLEAGVNWIPYIGTIANAIENNSDVTAFTVEKMNKLVDTLKLFVDACESGSWEKGKKALMNFLMVGLELNSIPANNIYNLIIGIMRIADPDLAVAIDSAKNGYTANTLKSKYSEAIKSGDDKMAKAYLGAWTAGHSVNITDEATLNEIVRLSKAGYNAVPPINADKYTDDKGNEVSFTERQATAFNTQYQKSNKVVSQLLKVQDYKKADDSSRARMLTQAYTTYRNAGIAKATGVAPNSKLSQLVYYCNGDVDLAKYIAHLQTLKNLGKEDDYLKTVNSFKDLNKQEKMLLVYLNGRSVKDKNSLSQLLSKMGMGRSDIKKFLKLEK